jgi:hypothetical protein
LRTPSRTLVSEVLSLKAESTNFEANNLDINLNNLLDLLMENGQVVLSIKDENIEQAIECALDLLTIPIWINDLIQWAHVSSINKMRGGWKLSFQTRNFLAPNTLEKMEKIELIPREIYAPPGNQNRLGFGREALTDLIHSVLSLNQLTQQGSEPIYIVSPWISNFPLFKNLAGQFTDLFSGMEKQVEVSFITFLTELSKKQPVRIITTKQPASLEFNNQIQDKEGIVLRFTDIKEHQKGLLTKNSYIKGSMNWTYSGVYLNGEKIDFRTTNSVGGRKSIADQYLTLNNIWDSIASND